MTDHYIIAYDIGTTTCKTCLYKITDKLILMDSAAGKYPSYQLPGGGIEQDPGDWWKAMCSTTQDIVQRNPGLQDKIKGISFCAQMQGLVLVDKDLKVLCPAMSYMDQRAVKQKKVFFEHGIRIEGMNLFKLLKSLLINGAVAGSVKDPVWKYKWTRENKPEIFKQVHKWLDVKDYLIARSTGECTMTSDSAFATFLTRQKNNKTLWSHTLLKMYGIHPFHMPAIINAVEIAGYLGKKQAKELYLHPGIPVFGGGGDASMITLGTGAVREGDTYIYTGTSGWVSTTVKSQKVDISSRIASIVGAQPGFYNYFAEQETAGKCLEWVKDHLALDEINVYLEQKTILDNPESEYVSLYDFLIKTIEQVSPGSGGVIFTPWIHGNRSPFEDPHVRGIFFNLSINTGKKEMIRAVVEGIIFHQKWLLTSIQKKFQVSDPIGFAGGGALSPFMAQLMADILEHPVQSLRNPQNCGAAGAALTAGIGLGLISGFSRVKSFVPVGEIFYPQKTDSAVYSRHFEVFKQLYPANKASFKTLNK